jgi:hypothetical protein
VFQDAFIGAVEGAVYAPPVDGSHELTQQHVEVVMADSHSIHHLPLGSSQQTGLKASYCASKLLSETVPLHLSQTPQLLLVNERPDKGYAVSLLEQSTQKLLFSPLPVSFPQAFLEILVGSELSAIAVGHLQCKVPEDPE